MAAGDSDNIFVADTIKVYYATEGTTLPTSLSNWETAKSSFTDVGLLSEDGFKESPSWDTTDVKDSDGNVCRTIKTGDALEWGMAFLETTDAIEDFIYGAHAHSGTPGNITGALPPVKVVVADLRDSVQKQQKLVVIPRAQIKDRGEVVYASSDSAKYECTLTSYKDASGNKAQIFRGAYV
jgi:hypothetical protein